jgi:hypothetical protein
MENSSELFSLRTSLNLCDKYISYLMVFQHLVLYRVPIIRLLNV